MNPFLYDVLRVLRNRGVILISILTALLALTVLTIFAGFAASGMAISASQEVSTVVLLMGLIYAFFVPTLGIQTAYSTYAKDRATGVLESVLVRPITRARLILSRFLAVAIASAIALGAALGFLALIFFSETSHTLPAGQLVALYAALLVEALSFAGILFLISHIVRTPGAIMGSAVVTFVLIDIIWFFLLFFVGIVGGGIATVQGQAHVVDLEYADPAGFPFLVITWVQGAFFDGTFPTPGGLGSIGISVPGLVAAGVFWTLAPIAAAFLLARNRD